MSLHQAISHSTKVHKFLQSHGWAELLFKSGIMWAKTPKKPSAEHHLSYSEDTEGKTWFRLFNTV